MNFAKPKYRVLGLAIPMGIFLILLCCPTPSHSASDNVSEIGDPGDTIIKRTSKLMNKDDPYYPCNDCHSTKEDYHNIPKELTEEHSEKKVHFPPDAKDSVNGEWCHRCHKEGNYQKIQLINGREIGFNESYLNCGQCHGTEYRDWKKNIHGQRTGKWNGPRKVSSCPECHDPHEPAFKPLKPKPAPVVPKGRSDSFLKLLLGNLIHEK